MPHFWGKVSAEPGGAERLPLPANEEIKRTLKKYSKNIKRAGKEEEKNRAEDKNKEKQEHKPKYIIH